MNKTRSIVATILILALVAFTIGLIWAARLENVGAMSATVSETVSPDLHGSCVFPVQDWHEDDYYSNCPEYNSIALTFSLENFPRTSFSVDNQANSSTSSGNVGGNPAPVVGVVGGNPAPVVGGSPAPVVGENPAKTCKNKNDGKDGFLGDCNAGKGDNKDKDKKKDK